MYPQSYSVQGWKDGHAYVRLYVYRHVSEREYFFYNCKKFIHWQFLTWCCCILTTAIKLYLFYGKTEGNKFGGS